MDSTSFFGRHGNVYIYLPNLIGKAPFWVSWAIESSRPRLLFAPARTRGAILFTMPSAGYARVACALFSFAVALRNPYYCVVSYFLG